MPSPNDDAQKAEPASRPSFWERLTEHPLARVGPGLITSVADDDPSGIATYS
jgi:Mn2+/Fe2+ NRAMP family transporter